MPKIDTAAWLKTQQAKHGLSDVEVAAAVKLFGIPEFDQTFVDTPTFQSELDRNVRPLKTQVQQLTQYNTAWQQEALKLGTKHGAVDDLIALGFTDEDLAEAGLRATRGGNVRNDAGQQFTAAEAQAMINKAVSDAVNGINQRVDNVRQGLVDISFFVPAAASRYRDEYGKPFDAAGFRKFAAENAAKYPDLDLAYDVFTGEDRKAKDTADRAKWEVDKEKEITARVNAQRMSPDGQGMPDDGGGAFFRAQSAKTDAAGKTEVRPPHSYSFASAETANTNVPSPIIGSQESHAIKSRLAEKYANADFSPSSSKVA